MTTLFTQASSITPRLRNLLVALLAFLLVSMGSAHIRAAVVVVQSENNLPRIIETEAHSSSPAAVKSAQVKMGRKPFEHRALEHRPVFVAHATAPQSPDWKPANPRAPPHSPRGPPAGVS